MFYKARGKRRMRIRARELMLVVILLMGFTVILARGAPSQPHNADAMWVEPAALNFDTNTTSVGFKFNVTVAMNFTGDTFAWQAVIYYNATQLNCTRVGATAPPTSEFMTDHSTTFSKAINPGSYPPIGDLKSVLAAETCSSPDFAPGPNSGTLFWAEFQILLAPGAGQTFNSKFDISTQYAATNTYVWDPTGNSYTFTPSDGTYQFTNSSGPPAPKPLLVSISPSSASVALNQTLLFTSNVTGGTGPYGFQWFLNNTAVPSATSNNWTFSSMINATYTVYLNVADNVGGNAISNTASVTVLFRIPGDVNGDNKVDGKDVALAALAFGSVPGTTTWNQNTDVNGDGRIDGKDLVIIVRNYGTGHFMP